MLYDKKNSDGVEIRGANLKITGRETRESKDITPIEWISGTDGTQQDQTYRPHIVTLLPGSYVFSETAAPAGYQMAADIAFTVENDGSIKINGEEVSDVTMEDKFKGQSLKVTKTVAGSMGDKSKEFSFELALTKGEIAEVPSSVQYVLCRNGEETNGTAQISNDGKFNFSLAHGEWIQFNNIPYGTVYSVREADAASLGYKVESTNGTGTLTVNCTAEFTNTRNIGIPTAADAEIPLGLLAVSVIGLAIGMLRRKRKAA